MVTLCSDHKLIFVMVPSTGSSALFKVLKEKFNGEFFPSEDLFKNGKKIHSKHTSLKNLLEHGLMTKEELDQYLKFATVRNPFDRFTSLYQRKIGEWWSKRIKAQKERLNLGNPEQEEREFLENCIKNLENKREEAKAQGFDVWLESFLEKTVSKNHKRKMSVLYPLIDGVDQIIRFESYEDDFNRLLKDAKIITLDEWVEIPQTNQTPGKKKYQDYYSEKSRAFIEENFSKELAAFNYKFE